VGTGEFDSAAEAYDHGVGRYGRPLAEELIGVASLEPGWRALDVGCGPGALTEALAELLGADRVAGVDPSEVFAEACRRRVPGADVRVGSGERLPFEPDEFDAALAQLVVQLMADREAGVREMARVVRPGGPIAACVWDLNEMPLLRTFWDAALAVAPERAGELDDARRVGFAAAEELGGVWEGAGLLGVATGAMTVQADYESFDDLFVPFTGGAGHSGACFAALPPADRDRLRTDVRRRLGDPGGPFTLTARAWWARGLSP